MRHEIFSPGKATFPLSVTLLMIMAIASPAQQHVIAQKDVTRPEAIIRSTPAFISSFTATKWNGYNEISWSTTYQEATRKFIVEYSVDGINYQSAAEALADRNLYAVKHQILDNRPMLYRIRIEQIDGRPHYSAVVLLEGGSVQPVKMFPTILTGTSVTVDTRLPIEKIIVTDEKGTQVFTKEFGAINERFSVQLPSMGKGIYFMSFLGSDNWKHTGKFIIP